MGSSPTSATINGPLVKRLRHRPFTAVTAVRFCYGSPKTKKREHSSLFFVFLDPSSDPHSSKWREAEALPVSFPENGCWPDWQFSAIYGGTKALPLFRSIICYGSPYATNPNYFVNRNWFGFVFYYEYPNWICNPRELPQKGCSRGFLWSGSIFQELRGIGSPNKKKAPELAWNEFPCQGSLSQPSRLRFMIYSCLP